MRTNEQAKPAESDKPSTESEQQKAALQRDDGGETSPSDRDGIRDRGSRLQAALLIIRAWVERGSFRPLRARIRLTKDVSNGFEKTATVTSPEAGAEIVKDWLEDLLVTDQLPEDVQGVRQDRAGHVTKATASPAQRE
jgi:hypothetical protein